MKLSIYIPDELGDELKTEAASKAVSVSSLVATKRKRVSRIENPEHNFEETAEKLLRQIKTIVSDSNRKNTITLEALNSFFLHFASDESEFTPSAEHPHAWVEGALSKIDDDIRRSISSRTGAVNG